MVRLIYNPIEVALETGDGIKGYICFQRLVPRFVLPQPRTRGSVRRTKQNDFSGVRHDADNARDSSMALKT